MSKKHKPSKSAQTGSKTKAARKARKQNLTWIWMGLGVIGVAVLAFFLGRAINPQAKEISPARAYALYQKGALFLDVRTQEEWDTFRLAKSTFIPLEELQNRLNELPKDKEIVVVCHSGERSALGAKLLQKTGFTQVYSLTGGLVAWNAAGYPLEGKVP